MQNYMITPDGFDAAAILAVFWARLKIESPTELELSYDEILDKVEMSEERKAELERIIGMMVTKGLLYVYD